MKLYKVWSFYTETSFIWAKTAVDAIAHYSEKTNQPIYRISARLMKDKEVAGA
jgi:hypothetical protein